MGLQVGIHSSPPKVEIYGRSGADRTVFQENYASNSKNLQSGQLVALRELSNSIAIRKNWCNDCQTFE